MLDQEYNIALIFLFFLFCPLVLVVLGGLIGMSEHRSLIILLIFITLIVLVLVWGIAAIFKWMRR